jgi:hypothetical protein
MNEGGEADPRFAWTPVTNGSKNFPGDNAVRSGPRSATIGPVVRVELERVEALELLGMTLAHLNDAEARAEMSPRVALLMAIRDKLAFALREES